MRVNAPRRHRGSPKGSGARTRGFSLLEVMVAFSIMALALGALYQLTGGATRASQQAEAVARMAVLAQARLAEHPFVPPEGVTRSGVSADGLAWRVESSPFPARAEPQPSRRLHRLTVSIETGSGMRPRRFELVTLVPEGGIR